MAAYKFIAEYLHLDLDKITDPKKENKIDESRVLIEKPEAIQVFNKAHPKPVFALRNDEAITKVLLKRQLKKISSIQFEKIKLIIRLFIMKVIINMELMKALF